MEEIMGRTSCYLKINFSDEIVETPAGNFEWIATNQPKRDDTGYDTSTRFEFMYDNGNSLLRHNETTGAMWGMTDDKLPRKARKGERAYYEFLHTIISSKKRFPINLLFQEPEFDQNGVIVKGDGTSFTEILLDKFDAEGLLSAFKLAGRYKNVQVDGQWSQVEQPAENWEATIDILLTVTEKDNQYKQTCLADKFIRTGYTQGLARMIAQNEKRAFVYNKEGGDRKVHYTIEPQEFVADALPF